MRIIIVGGGIAGLSTAFALTRAGHTVHLFEQGALPNPLAASGDHHRIIRRAYGSAGGYAAPIAEAYDAWEDVWQALAANHHDPRGFICVSRAPGDDAECYRDGLAAGGYPFVEFDAAEMARRYPFFDAGTIRFGFHSPEGGALHCRRIAGDMVRWLEENGATISTQAEVAAVDADRASVVLADGETFAADRVIVAAGAWVLKLFPELARHLAIYRTAVAYLDPPDDLRQAWAAAPVVLDTGGETDGYIIPPTGGAGLKFGSGLHKRLTPDADANRTARPGEGEEIRNLFAPPIARIEEYRVRDVVTCAYTFTSDKRFFADAFGRTLVISACSGHGYKFGAAVGRRVARWVDDADTSALLGWLRA